MKYLMERCDHLSTRRVASTGSTETWDVLCGNDRIGTYFRSGKEFGYPLRIFDGDIPGYVNRSIVALPEPFDGSPKMPVGRVHLEFNTAATVPYLTYPTADFVKHSVRHDGLTDIPFP